jgi:long-chain acyl-CoA synthetase
VFQGYYKMSDKTELSIDEEGWFHTGDIGVWLPGGRLRIVDRQKNMFKLAQGEYIVPDKVENVYNNSEYVAQSFLYGDSMQHACVVIVAPEEELVKRLARETLGPEADSMSFEQLCEKEELKKKMLEHLVALGKERKLNSLEQAKAIHLTPEQFTIENGLLTPTYKVKREVARERYKEAIKRMYSAMGGIGGKHVFQE